ncbi:hypothetical protein BYT27DRAFT_7227091 [Phlegmacium glaucopus]|nr:hypothetical protein BYT27DRAFT_7227091 [Phlegmacium glaucopus]
MDEICSDIVNMLRPSWLTSVPSDFGLADQWRILGTTILPISLIRLWSVVERCHQILDMTMSLLSAIAIACSRVTSKKHANLYFKNMHLYLSSLKVLFPQYSLHPNHHMALHLSEYPSALWPCEYEETISRSFVQSAALKNLILKTGTPELQNTEETAAFY